ncbi:MAG TPA: hypothetical protein VN577_06450 [Terriglobales bacterium]|nr:hypothetical protein [Terriglobales bacterium]
MRRLLVFAWTLLFASVSFTSEIAVIEPGEFHGADVESIHVEDGELWLGLYANPGGHFWQRVVVRVESSRDEMVDDEGQTTGRIFTATTYNVPLFLVRGLDDLLTQKVITSRMDVSLANGSVEPVSLNGTDYRIEVTNPKSKEKQITDGSAAVLIHGAERQELFTVPNGANEPDWRLIWAGDLDGDGKLDLYIDMSDHYNVSQRRLFLSSRAEPGKLVKQVAEFVTTGC